MTGALGKIIAGVLLVGAFTGFTGWYLSMERYKDLENRVAECERRRTILENEMAASSEHLSSRETTLTQTIRDLENKLKTKGDEWLLEKDSLTSQVMQLNKEAGDQEALNAQLKEAINAQDTAFRDLADKLKQKEAELADAQAAANDMADLHRQALEKAKALEKDAAEAAAKKAQSLKSSDLKIADLEEKIGRTAETLAEKNARISKMAAALKEKEQDLAAKADEITRIKSGLKAEQDQARQALTARLQAVRTAKEKEITDLKSMAETYQQLARDLKGEIEEKSVTLEQFRQHLTVKILNRIVFDSGSARISPDGFRVLDTIAERLGAALNDTLKDRLVRIEGHSDNRPIGHKLMETYPTNWELSAARANNVVRHLSKNPAFPPGKLFAANFAHHRPVADNATPEGRALNRRIEIVLMPEPDRDRIVAP